MALIIIYVGAVAILFLFVVMMLNVGMLNIKQYAVKNSKLLMLLSLFLAIELIFIIYSSIAVESTTLLPNAPFVIEGTQPNANQIGLLLYTDYGYLFQICGFILFAAIIAAIMLTHRNTTSKRTQNTEQQLSRNKKNSITLVNVKLNSGVNVIDRN
jgi:NADH-quinone oxidoreductase subunit J